VRRGLGGDVVALGHNHKVTVMPPGRGKAPRAKNSTPLLGWAQEKENSREAEQQIER